MVVSTFAGPRRGARCLGGRNCGSTLHLRLAGLTCHATSANVAAENKVPFGGAIVTKLAGSTKIAKGGDQRLVPLLGPGSGPQPRLPFGASVECFKKLSSSEGSRHSGLPSPHSGTSRSMPAEASSSQMLDIFYVLAGSGTVTSSDGTVRNLHPGDSLVAWHSTTEVRPISPEYPPAVLKFHFPASILMLPPGSLVAPAPSHADLAILIEESQGDEDGELSPEEADDMLSGVQQRAAQAIERLYGGQQADTDGSGVAVNANGSAAAVAVAPTSNNIVPFGPFFRQLLHSAVAPAAGGFRLLRSALRRPVRKNGAAAPHGALDGAGAGAPPSSGLEGEVAAPGAASASGSVLLQRTLEEFKAFRFPRQTNKLAFVFDPSELGLSLSFGVEVFEPGHHTPLHIHKAAHELFFVLAGEGVAFCNGQRFTVRAGDCVVFPPRAVHGIDNNTGSKLYCLQLMTPNEAFVEHVKSGEAVGRLDDEDLCNLTARHC